MKRGSYLYEIGVREMFSKMGYSKAEIDELAGPLPKDEGPGIEEYFDRPAVVSEEAATAKVQKMVSLWESMGYEKDQIDTMVRDEVERINKANQAARERYSQRKAARLQRLKNINRKNKNVSTADLRERPGKPFSEWKRDIEAGIKTINETVRKVREGMTR